MKVLQLNKTIFKLLGIIDFKQDPNHIQIIIIKYICFISPIFFLTSLIGFFLMSLTDVAQATSAFYLICIEGMGFLIHLDCFVNRKTVHSIFERFQSLADTCDPNFQPFYIKCEHQISRFVHHFKILLFTLVFSVISIPIIFLTHQYLNGNFSMDLLVLPASLLYEIFKS